MTNREKLAMTAYLATIFYALAHIGCIIRLYLSSRGALPWKGDVAISALTIVILSAAKDLYEGKTIDSSVALLPQNDKKGRPSE